MLSKDFDSETIEKKWYEAWLSADVFSAEQNQDGSQKNSVETEDGRSIKETKTANTQSSGANGENNPSSALNQPFSLVIPPPNVTGRLHMGHALNNTIQDLVVRYRRMSGYDTVWVPGTDHAGIATQSVVKKSLDSKGIDYRELGREEFIKRVFEWKEKYGNYILGQIKGLGASCDWSRTRFTMDEKLSKAVMHAFCKLYHQGLIYEGERIVNWCPVDQTALSDDEVETAEGGEPGYLYEIAYRIIDDPETLTVATTRPETLFGDVAVAVHPEDERYKHLVGKLVALPLTNREIPIIADEAVERDFGTGCLKVTPAHDKNDFEIGKRHGLASINIMNPDASLNVATGKSYAGLPRYKARAKVIKDLQEQGLLLGKTQRMVPLGRSYRSKEIIEYRLSKQWFVKMEPLANKVLGEISNLHFYPASFKKIFCYWLENIQDWCISRQIWWGHRIPVWKNKVTGEVLVEPATPVAVQEKPEDWRQETDVLDTWFSSALFPMSVFGWPDKTPDMERYFPTNLLSTAKDIIFFWVARMCMFSLHFEGKLPFRNVLIHQTIVDHHGKTMSKSKGNGIDPVTVISGASLEKLKMPILESNPPNAKKMLGELEKRFPKGFKGVGCDALRYTLLHLMSSSQLVQLSMSDFNEIGRRFITKLWNGTRFAFFQLESFIDSRRQNDENIFLPNFSKTELQKFFAETTEVEWMIGKLQQTQNTLQKSIANYDIGNYSFSAYQLVWTDFCDWYVEMVKIRLQQLAKQTEEIAEKEAIFTLGALLHVLKSIATLLHPAIPFVTEEMNSALSPKMAKFLLPFDNSMLAETSFTLSSFAFPLENGETLTHPSVERVFPKKDLAQKKPEVFLMREKTIKQEKKVEEMKNIVSSLRSLRKRFNVTFKHELEAFVVDDGNLQLSDDLRILHLAQRLGGASIKLVDKNIADKQAESPTAVVETAFSIELVLQLGQFLDVEKEIERARKEKQKKTLELEKIEIRLGSEGFVTKANPQLVAKMVATKRQLKDRLDKLQKEIFRLTKEERYK